jgi:hypothetical protein
MPDKNKASLFGRKRLWCSLRDYLKSPEFNDVFVAALTDAGAENPAKWARVTPELKAALVALELPGDVWNNWPVFRQGLFAPCLQNEPASWDMPRTIRRVHELLSEGGSLDFYPEQLDVTFDFVPRMCEAQMCDVCVFGRGVKDVCHRQAGFLCPVALISCKYRHVCSPDVCRLKQDVTKGFCHSAMTTP